MPAPAAVAGLALVCLVVAICGGLVASPLRAPAPSASPTPAESPRGPSGGAHPAPSAPAVTPGEPGRGEVVVHVVGAVAQPGLVTLPAGARVATALTKAGGPLENADLGQLNLARPLSDGEQVRVPLVGEEPPPGPAGEGVGGGQGAAGGGVVAINEASAAEIQTLPGIGPALAERIVAFRADHGRFRTLEDLTQVSGIGPKTLERLRTKVRL